MKAAEDLVSEGLDNLWLDIGERKIFSSENLSDELLREFNSKYQKRYELLPYSPPIGRGLTIDEVNRRFLDVFMEATEDSIKYLLKRTALVGREHALFITEDGKGIAIEGEEMRVLYIPTPLCATVHTHPYRSPTPNLLACLPSPADVRNAVDFFLNGGYIFGIACYHYILFFQRIGILTEDQLDTLMMLSKKIEQLERSLGKEKMDPFEQIKLWLKELPIKMIIWQQFFE
ncbi:MAG: hypothetical protein GU347_03285 [Desulfurococcales archaeon]|nr:hypothetical protein [Desulfurococcales archaeon]